MAAPGYPVAEHDPGGVLPELAQVYWRPRASALSLRRRGQLWTGWMVALTVPFFVAGAALIALEPLSFPVAIAAMVHAWVIPELYAFRGATVVRAKSRRPTRQERVARGLLADLLGHDARELQLETGLAMERGKLGVWLVGEAGALLVAPGAKRVHCFCVGVNEDGDLPPSDKIAHLLLALRTDEEGFATVANHAFAGAPWRVRRRLAKEMRPALAAARDAAKGSGHEPVRSGSGTPS
jgi:hypothetical protein